MKKILLSLALLLCVGSSFGQTAEKLMEKYKAFPGAEYEETTKATRKSIEESKEKGTGGLSKEDYDFMLKNLKKVEQIQLTLDDDQLEQLNKDFCALKAYETLFMQNDNKEAEKGQNFIQNKINQTFNPNYQMRVYGKVKGNTVNDLLIRWDIWGEVAMAHVNGKFKKDLMLKSILSGDLVNFEEGGNSIDMKDAVKEVKDGNALFVINGEEHPELHSEKDAIEYMSTHNISWNHESWVVGGAVKEKYPNTDKKVVIEYTDEPKK